MKSILIFALGIFPFVCSAQNFLDWNVLEKRFAQAGGNTHAFKQVKCFLEKSGQDEHTPYVPSDVNFDRRCIEQGNISISNQRHFAIIDYTMESDRKRFFIVDRATGEIFKTAVAHGRYKASYINIFNGFEKNTIKNAKYFSNVIDSNASSSGLYIAAQDYKGGFGRSLVLHGLEKDVNHNACERAIVIHPHTMVSQDKAKVMSSGCPMVSHKVIDYVIDTIGGKSLSEDDILMTKSGSLVYIYTEREKNLNCR